MIQPLLIFYFPTSDYHDPAVPNSLEKEAQCSGLHEQKF
jgi:hypothetical protein